MLFTLLCSSPARESFQNNPRWQHSCFSYYCLALSLSILLEGLQSTWLFDFAHILGKMTKSGKILENEISQDLFKISRASNQYFQEMPWANLRHLFESGTYWNASLIGASTVVKNPICEVHSFTKYLISKTSVSQ